VVGDPADATAQIEYRTVGSCREFAPGIEVYRVLTGFHQLPEAGLGKAAVGGVHDCQYRVALS
jgi:hypothetical protein